MISLGGASASTGCLEVDPYEDEELDTEETTHALLNPGSGPWHNSCVNNVVSQFNSLPTTGKVTEVLVGQRFDDVFEGPAFSSHPELFMHSNACHIQGVARLRKAPYFAFVYNSKGAATGGFSACEYNLNNSGSWPFGAVLGVAKIGNYAGDAKFGSNTLGQQYSRRVYAANRTTEVMDEDRWHPGGVQAIGDYLLVGMDDRCGSGDPDCARAALYHMYDPTNPNLVRNDYFPHNAETIGITRLANSDWLWAVGSNSGERFDFYRITFTPNYPPYVVFQQFPLNHEWTWTHNSSYGYSHKNMNGINLLSECGTGKTFMLGADKTSFIGGEDFVRLFEVDLANQTMIWKGDRHMTCGVQSITQRRCNFMAGTGSYVTETGKLAFYASEHYGSLDMFGIYPYIKNRQTEVGVENFYASWGLFDFTEYFPN